MVYAFPVRALGIDYGKRRIGLALSDPTGALGRPWEPIARSGDPARIAGALAAEVSVLAAEDEGLGAIAFGYPRRLNGQPTGATGIVETIVTLLRSQLDVPIVLQDERLSS